ncbi:hypothetical protein NP554_21825 [Pseudomonas asiatica]|uniref:Uncharacterized protein n=1 Tax=Pseudomonas asiatica TaxID=2219225 RepID=A0A9X4HZ45_9PSED|nr:MULTISPECIES: hypothetical protein [Pseudomonas]MDD2108743.1 hypothetical protein [Pseudomonas asiatica]MDD2114425.1 hypothetical protein [Pseudomonas asiatica]OUS78845.1 hypothetical protein CBP05_28450 [Pseudomonas putida]OUS87481.1 hypothetical protein CBP06_15100 [Pseudomonas putida]
MLSRYPYQLLYQRELREIDLLCQHFRHFRLFRQLLHFPHDWGPLESFLLPPYHRYHHLDHAPHYLQVLKSITLTQGLGMVDKLEMMPHFSLMALTPGVGRFRHL